MPRSGGGVYSAPVGTTAVTGTAIESAPYNALIADLVADANAARPVSAGGTGAANAADARTNLGATVTGAAVFTAADAAAARTSLAVAYSSQVEAETGTNNASVMTPLRVAQTFDFRVRRRLTANTTFYVRTDGNDANDGSANTSGAAFLTLQGAWDYVKQRIDLAGWLVTIQIADGTYNKGVKDTQKPIHGGRVFFSGNMVNPQNVVINEPTVGDDCFLFDNSEVVVGGLTMTSAGSALHTARNGVILTSGPLRFGTCTEHHFFADNLGMIVVNDGYTIVGACDSHIFVHSNAWLATGAITITRGTGTHNFPSGFIIATIGGVAETIGLTFSGAGSITGRRFLAEKGGKIVTGTSGNLTYFNGSVAGENPSGFYDDDIGGTRLDWTPAYGGETTPGSTTYSSRGGNYTKTGKMVAITCRVQWTAHSSGVGTATISGLPIAAAFDATFAVWHDGLTAGSGKQVTAFLSSGATSIRLFASDPAGGSFASIPTEAAGDLIITGTYIVL
jgi:hypothetical protein